MSLTYDTRLVRFENIHGIKMEEIEACIKRVGPFDGAHILDAMCGYGAVASWILQAMPSVHMTCLDASAVQIARAHEELRNQPNVTFIQARVQDMKLPPACMDAVVVKMSLHEIPQAEQQASLQLLANLLRPRGRLVIWTIALDHVTQPVAQDIIREKDRLAGLDEFVRHRYFFRIDELMQMTQACGLVPSGVPFESDFFFATELRLATELGGNRRILHALNDYLRSNVPRELLDQFKYQDDGENVSVRFPQRIYTFIRR